LARKLKAVIDTNLFISGLFAKDSLSAQLKDLELFLKKQQLKNKSSTIDALYSMGEERNV
jgi:predicted nucleic acid-binding protein